MNQVLTSARANNADFARRILRRAIDEDGVNLTVWATRNGFSVQYVSAVLLGRKPPSDSLCARIGLRKVTSYVYDAERARVLG